MLKGYCYKLQPNNEQIKVLESWLNMLRSQYNYNLRDRIDSYDEAKYPKLGNYCDIKSKAEICPLTCNVSKNSSIGYPWKETKKKGGQKRSAYEIQSANLPILKQERPWYKTIHSTVLQQNLKRLDEAFKKFFSGAGYPKFKAKHKFRSFKYPPNQVEIIGNKIRLPSIGWMTYFKSRDIPDGFTAKSVTVKKKSDGWYVAIAIEDTSIPQVSCFSLEQVKTVIGCDLGIKKLLALSNGEQILNPQFEKQLERQKTIRQRRASRKKKGSRNQKKAYKRLGLIDLKIVNQRNDYQWKIANKLAKLADVIVLEDLNIQGMIKRCKPKQDENGKYLKNGQSAKKGLNRLIRDCAWGELVKRIESVAAKLGNIVVKVDPKHTSQKCPKCNHIDKRNRDKEKFVCIECGWLADADNNAGYNIGLRGIKELGLNESKLLGVPQEVTPQLEVTSKTTCSQEISVSLEIEPGNQQPEQLCLFKLEEFDCGCQLNLESPPSTK